MGLVESKDDERLSWPIVRVQHVVWVHEATEPFSSVCHPVMIITELRMSTLVFSDNR
jgi:hypothetical protein